MSIVKARNIIEISFKDKFDKGGEPYKNHLFRVAKNFSDIDDNLIIIGLLHDLLEDCPEWTESDLRVEFDSDIVDAVVCLTRKKLESYEDYINRIKSNRMSLMVKIADLKDNMDITRLKKITDKDVERLKKYHKTWLELSSLV